MQACMIICNHLCLVAQTIVYSHLYMDRKRLMFVSCQQAIIQGATSADAESAMRC